jgi:alpha-ketoglutarate-dependent 2,4-dichlorophenoxyacetate dioxygenase
MPIVAKQMHPLFAAELSGVHLARASEADLAEILAAMDRYAVCAVHHDTPLTDEEHVAFSKRLGPVHKTRAATTKDGREPRIRFLEIIDQSNLDEYGDLWQEGDRSLLFKRANRLWHTDMSFATIRATYSLLSAHRLPPGGGPDTEFADMRAAYDALPEAMKKRIEGLTVEHSYWHSRVMGGGPEATPEELKRMPPARHKLVHVHPRSGRKVLYMASHAREVIGWPMGEGRALIQELAAHATQERFVYAHKWRVGDVVIWDNLATMHRARPFDDLNQIRDVRRTTCREAPEPAATA